MFETTSKFVFLIYMENHTSTYVYYISFLRSAFYTFVMF